ncbi:hypothetical protein KY290_029938 [Solanum tuberosum]|uniref:Neprosin PEP catalytic domain-containing protein n=1 Tax=Solanum tuberosum TaxID=4113 RepID=A0ABQ7UM48_SOLTU|nr:hypothetical protein KY290_029938 [Solanum tuberosum]
MIETQDIHQLCIYGQKKLSKLEDAELEKQLKSLNKTAVKTVKAVVLPFTNNCSREIVLCLKARIPYNPNSKFAGAGMDTTLYNPQVKGQQHSRSRLKNHKGSDILQVGWRAGKIHCFNTLCPGFVQVNYDLPLDNSFMDTISQRGGRPCGARMYIDRDLAGN